MDFDDGTLKGVPGRARSDDERTEAAAVKADVARYDGVAGAALRTAVAVGIEDERFGRGVGVGCHF